MSNYLIVGLVWILNFAISWWNAYAAGSTWVESKVAGGGRRAMAWIVASMSACGFTWCYLILECVIVYKTQLIDAYWLGIALEAGYVLLIPVVLVGSYAITLDSWGRAFRNGGVLNYGAAAYNTWATYHNTYNAINSFGGAFSDVVKAFTNRSKSDRDGNSGGLFMAVFVGILVFASALLGILTTSLIVKKAAARDPLPKLKDLERKRA